MILLRFNNLGLGIFLIICTLIVLASYIITKGFAFNYMRRILNPDFSKIVGGVHVVLSIIFGSILPNNFLNEIKWINNLYNQSDLWIPISMALITLLLLITIGSVISLFLKILSRTDK